MFVHQPMYLCTHRATNISVCDHLYLYWVKCDFVSIPQLHSITSRIFPASFLVYLWILTPTVTNLAPSICHPLTNLPKSRTAHIGGSECQPFSPGDSISWAAGPGWSLSHSQALLTSEAASASTSPSHSRGVVAHIGNNLLPLRFFLGSHNVLNDFSNLHTLRFTLCVVKFYEFWQMQNIIYSQNFSSIIHLYLLHT